MKFLHPTGSDDTAFPRQLLKIDEVTAILSISKPHAYQLVQRGDIACVRLGRSIRVRMEDMERFFTRTEEKLGVVEYACNFEYPEPRMFRPSLRRASPIESLIINMDDALPDVDTSIDIYQFWMRHN